MTQGPRLDSQKVSLQHVARQSSSSSSSKDAVAATASDDIEVVRHGSKDAVAATASEVSSDGPNYDPFAEANDVDEEVIMRADGLIEPAPGKGRKRARKRGKAARAKSHAKYEAKRGQKHCM